MMLKVMTVVGGGFSDEACAAVSPILYASLAVSEFCWLAFIV